METNEITKTFTRSVAQASLFRSVYVWMTLALVITGFTALYVAKSYTLLNLMLQNRMAFSGNAQLLSSVWYSTCRPASTASPLQQQPSCFIVYSILNGVTMSMLFLIYTMSSIATTSSSRRKHGAMALFGYATKKDLTRIGNLCIMGVIGLIIASLVNMFLHNSVMDLIISYVGVLLFVGLTAYDSQKIKQMLSGEDIEVNETTQKIHTDGSPDSLSGLH